MSRRNKHQDEELQVEQGTEVEQTEVQTDETEGQSVESKAVSSIVPAKYAGKYKNGGSDELAQFINAQSKDEGENAGFDFFLFFELCHKNGIDRAHTAPFETMVVDKVHGSQGRARMTLRNRLASIARKNGKLVGLDGQEVEINLPPLPKREKAEKNAA